VFPYFIAHGLPAGVSGLVVAGLFAAAMSSLSSGFNAVSAVVISDFWDRFGKSGKAPEHLRVRKAKFLVFVIGVITIVTSAFVGQVSGNWLEMTQKISNLMTVPLFCLMFMALFVPWATSWATIVAACYGIGVSVLIAFWDLITGQSGLGFQWIGIVTLLVQLPVGILLSLLRPTHLRSRIVVTSISLVPLLMLYIYVLFEY
jgi:SSS family solute:Na+ symporter